MSKTIFVSNPPAKKSAKLQWRIYYGDGTTFDNTMGTPNKAPPTNVQAIVGYDKDVGRIVLHFWDWYYFRKDGVNSAWWGADLHGLLDQLMWDTEGNVIAVKPSPSANPSVLPSVFPSIGSSILPSVSPPLPGFGDNIPGWGALMHF